MVGAVNLYVAYNYSMETWVSFKLWSSLGFSVLLILLIGVVMGPHLKEVANSDENKNTTTF
jgi:intracellular septation protein